MLGQLRRLFDGKLRPGFGTGKHPNYGAKFGLIIGVTNAIDKHTRLIASLGERFLMYRLPALAYVKRLDVGNMAICETSKERREKPS